MTFQLSLNQVNLIGEITKMPRPTKTGAERKPYGDFGPKNRRKFLKELRRTCNITMAAQKVGITKVYAQQVKLKDPDFKAAWQNALDEGIDLLEDSARKRAFDGVKKEVYYQGKVCGKFHEHSDGLTTFLLKAHRPEKYRDHSTVDLNHKGGVLIIPPSAGGVDKWLEENSAKMEIGDDDERGEVDE